MRTEVKCNNCGGIYLLDIEVIKKEKHLQCPLCGIIKPNPFYEE